MWRLAVQNLFQKELWVNVNIYSNELMVQKQDSPHFSLQTIAFFVGLILRADGHFKQFPFNFQRRIQSAVHRTETHVYSEHKRGSREIWTEMMPVLCQPQQDLEYQTLSAYSLFVNLENFKYSWQSSWKPSLSPSSVATNLDYASPLRYSE